MPINNTQTTSHYHPRHEHIKKTATLKNNRRQKYYQKSEMTELLVRTTTSRKWVRITKWVKNNPNFQYL